MFVAAILLALFTVLFGTRRFEVAGRSEGLIALTAAGEGALVRLPVGQG